jgi:class 3 adenylate cyclase/pimeloyl-ACP methyl ester carboxylesterase
VGDADVAYQIVGDGPIDLLYFFSLGCHIELFWDTPAVAETLRRLASFSRLIIFDCRGTGSSDKLPGNAISTWEEVAVDIEAVLDAAGSTHTAILAPIDAGPGAILFAAMHPKRVRGLVLFNTSARLLVADDYPIGFSPEFVDAQIDAVGTLWGTPEMFQMVMPSLADDVESLESLARQYRSALTPRRAVAEMTYRLHNGDVRQALPLIQAPTLVAHVRDNPMLSVEQSRYLVDHIPGASFLEVPGADLGISPTDAFMDEVARFLTGECFPFEVERILATVLFTDIASSTERAAALGDRRWRSLLDAHDRTVRDQLRRFRGNEINTTGDGFVASFDGPARAIRCAHAILDATRTLGIDLRIGMHTGECEVRGDDLGGLAVHIAARVGALAQQGEVLVSSTVKDLVVGSGIYFEERGEHGLKGVPGTWKLFAALP